MELAIYRALKSINIEEDAVEAVITAMEKHIEERVNQGLAPALAKIDAVQAQLIAKMDAGLSMGREERMRWTIGTGLVLVGLFFTGAFGMLGLLRALGKI